METVTTVCDLGIVFEPLLLKFGTLPFQIWLSYLTIPIGQEDVLITSPWCEFIYLVYLCVPGLKTLLYCPVLRTSASWTPLNSWMYHLFFYQMASSRYFFEIIFYITCHAYISFEKTLISTPGKKECACIISSWYHLCFSANFHGLENKGHHADDSTVCGHRLCRDMCAWCAMVAISSSRVGL